MLKPKILRAGVMVSESKRKMSVSVPVVRVTKAIGSAPNRPRQKSHSNKTSGTRQLIKTVALPNVISFSFIEARVRIRTS